MSLIVTPRQLAQRAELYHQLGQLTAAGIGLKQALEIQHRSPPSRDFRQPLAVVLEKLSLGSTFTEGIGATGNWLPQFDRALLAAGETSGRLPACLKLLTDHYTERAALLRQTISSLAYPVFLFHFAILIGPIQEFFLPDGSTAAYFVKTVGVLAPSYVVVGLLLYALQGRHGEGWRSLIEQIAHRVPLVGKARRNLALARLASALEALLSAGVPIFGAWEMAAASSGSPALKRAVYRWRPDLEAGVTPGELLSQSAEFPDLFASMYQTGEMSGSLDETLLRLRGLHQEEGSRQLKAIADWTPKIFYFGIMMMIAWRVLSFYIGYFGQLGSVMEN